MKNLIFIDIVSKNSLEKIVYLISFILRYKIYGKLKF